MAEAKATLVAPVSTIYFHNGRVSPHEGVLEARRPWMTATRGWRGSVMDVTLHIAIDSHHICYTLLAIFAFRVPSRFSCTSPNFGISPSSPCTNSKFQSRAVPGALGPEMSPSTSRQVPRRSSTSIKTSRRRLRLLDVTCGARL